MSSRSRPSRDSAPAAEAQAPAVGRWSRAGVTVLGAVLGGLAGGFVVVGVTLVLKAGMDYAAVQPLWFIAGVPLLGLAVAVLVLQGFGTTTTPSADGARRASAWRAFPPGAIRADISGDVVDCAGQEERFPWRLAPIRAVAILATVGTGGAMGTEAPAAYLGVAAGDCLCDRGKWWRRLLRPSAVAGGAAGVGALMGIALVGMVFILELGRRRNAPFSAERVTAALIGGLIGQGIDVTFGLSLIRLVVPKEAPGTLLQAVITALFIGAASGVISGLAGLAVNRAKKWQAPPAVRLALAGAATVVIALVIAKLALPSAAVGPGGGAILWAESVAATPMTLLAVCLLCGAATIATVAAGGCGGVFVPFLAVGDLAGRVFAPGLGIGNDLAGAAGAAGGIAGGYRLPLTAAAMVLGVGGPLRSTMTCLVTVLIASAAGAALVMVAEKLKTSLFRQRQAPVH